MGMLLQIKNISKEFPGVKALDDVSLDVQGGSIHSLMGENGAGKSTLMKCLFGIYSADSGEFVLEGKRVSFPNAREAMLNGVSMVHQELNQVHTRSVMENIWLGRFPGRFAVVNHAKMHRDTQAIFAELGISIDPRAIISSLSVSQRQMVEIAKAVSHNSKIIVFDEPTSSLTQDEVDHLFEIIFNLRDKGCGIIYISHRMNEILKISDDVSVMRDGKLVGTEPAANLTTERIITMMVGRELDNVYPPKDNVPGAAALSVEGLSAMYRNLNDVSFELRKGEILGIAGLVGAGRTELLEALFGLSTVKSGKIIKDDKIQKNKNSRRSKRNGFAMLTEERRATGIFGILSVRENVTVANIKSYRRGPYISSKKMQKDTDWAITALRVKTPGQETKINSLSGGNQQKVIFGRWLLTQPDILLLDEPTRGIDVGAKYEIYQLMIDLAKEGKSIIMVSSELPELLGVCDRILVMSGGRLSGELEARNTTQEEIMALAAKNA
ncbi:MAG: sugar ABC transporter ATP-binding protein [Clostridiales bacterium]|jgi:methyl-galactoside transport system ATP-binding protein|nr:sugar ABC transporter ATP-binding protein [Clostridiales bacterium]